VVTKRPRHKDRMQPSATKRGPGRRHEGGEPTAWRGGPQPELKPERAEKYMHAAARRRARADKG
jgi:hypothetical protein